MLPLHFIYVLLKVCVARVMHECFCHLSMLQTAETTTSEAKRPKTTSEVELAAKQGEVGYFYLHSVNACDQGVGMGRHLI